MGRWRKFIGDAVFAVFGVPTAHEDDPARALRAALRMRRGLERLNRSLEDAHAVRLACGSASTPARSWCALCGPEEGFVTGDAVNVAARLEQGAEPGQILVGERTARAARGMAFKELGPLDLKGKDESIRAFELLESDVAQPGTISRDDGRPYRTRMVGRVGELTMLDSVLQRCVADRRPQLVTIYGDAGVGEVETRRRVPGTCCGLTRATAHRRRTMHPLWRGCLLLAARRDPQRTRRDPRHRSPGSGDREGAQGRGPAAPRPRSPPIRRGRMRPSPTRSAWRIRRSRS